MAQKFLSPGVFTTEVDQSFLAQGVAGIGAALIGRTLKGPAFLPLVVDGFDAFANNFGATDRKMQMPYAAKNYLKNASNLTTVRVLGHADGTSVTNGHSLGFVVALSDSGSNGRVFAEVHIQPSLTASAEQVSGDTTSFVFRVKTGAAAELFAVTASFLTSSQNYFGKVLNTDPTMASTYGHYVYRTFGYAAQAYATASVIGVSGALASFARDYEGGSTPYVKSQPIGGTDFSLFRFYTIPDGRTTNDSFKIEIANVKQSASPLSTRYGTFDVAVRDFYDSDSRRVVLESFTGCTLDPNSPNYILRKIGDKYEVFNTTSRKFVAYGTFPSKSKFIRIDMNTSANPPAEALPWGHRGYSKLQWVSGTVLQDMPLTQNQLDRNGNLDPNISFGISFVSGGIADRMRAFPNSATAGYITTDTEFSLGFLTSSYTNGKQVWSYSTSIPGSQYHQAVYASASLYSFVMPFFGGFDGFDLRVDNPLYLSNSADETDIGVLSLKRAVDTIANPDAFDINLLAIPGVHNLKVTDYARRMVNDRQDAMFIMDVTGSEVSQVVNNLKNREIDDNYTACYYPDLQLNDKNANCIVRVAPSVALMGAIAFSDRVGQVFFAPAGLARGGLKQFDIIDVADRLNFSDRNDLYDNRINPIATFPAEGIVVFGQKTLQIKSSALDRVNVRRLLIYAKKTVASAAKYLLFEGNNNQTWQRFKNTVNPILEKIRTDQGLVRFKVVMDTTTNTDDVIDRNIMVGKIFLQPTKATEFIDISFQITNAGVSFGE